MRLQITMDAETKLVRAIEITIMDAMTQAGTTVNIDYSIAIEYEYTAQPTEITLPDFSGYVG